MPRKNIIGLKFGRLKVLGLSEERDKRNTRKYLCQCDCGKTTNVRRFCITSGNTTSCGCYSLERKRFRNWKGYKKISKIVFNTIEKMLD